MSPPRLEYMLRYFGVRHRVRLGGPSPVGEAATRTSLEGWLELRDAFVGVGAAEHEGFLVSAFEELSSSRVHRRLPPGAERSAEFRRMIRELDSAAAVGFLVVETEVESPSPLPGPVDEEPERPLTFGAGVPPIPEPTFFEVIVVDERGDPVAGAAVRFRRDGADDERTTDGTGRARVDGVEPGFATLDIERFPDLCEVLRPRWDAVREAEYLEEGPDLSVRSVVDPIRAVPLVAGESHTVSLQPRVMRARLLGMFFDTNKTFLLPSAIPSMRGIRKIYDEHPDTALLIVGHTDVTGEPEVNDPLSLERAASVSDYLRDNVDGWLEWYEAATPAVKRWGAKEDHLMLESLPDFSSRPAEEPTITWFQRTRGLAVDGVAGPQTRTALIREYMSFDETSLPSGVPVTLHGCGESFPEEVQGSTPNVGSSAADHQRQRRVEIFFFRHELGVQPPPPSEISAAGSSEYPEWVHRSRETRDFEAQLAQALELRLHDPGSRPWPKVFARVTMGSVVRVVQADDEGWIVVLLPPVCPLFVRVEWGAERPTGPFPLSRDAFTDCSEGSRAQQAVSKLHNLGYVHELGLELSVKSFQVDYEVDHLPAPLGLVAGELPKATEGRLDAIFREAFDATP